MGLRFGFGLPGPFYYSRRIGGGGRRGRGPNRTEALLYLALSVLIFIGLGLYDLFT